MIARSYALGEANSAFRSGWYPGAAAAPAARRGDRRRRSRGALARADSPRARPRVPLATVSARGSRDPSRPEGGRMTPTKPATIAPNRASRSVPAMRMTRRIGRFGTVARVLVGVALLVLAFADQPHEWVWGVEPYELASRMNLPWGWVSSRPSWWASDSWPAATPTARCA